MIDKNTYNKMMTGIATNCSTVIKTIDSSIKISSTAFFLIERFLNFSEKSGMSTFIKILKTMVVMIKKYWLVNNSFKKVRSLYNDITGNESTNKAIAGVGNPMK